MRPKKFNKKGKQKTPATIEQDLGLYSDEWNQNHSHGKKVIASNESTSSSSKPIESQNDKERSEIFHIRVIKKHTKVDTLSDCGSQFNLISKAVVKKLNLDTTPHTKPYRLGWVCDDDKLQVIRKRKLKFPIIVNFIEEVELDV